MKTGSKYFLTSILPIVQNSIRFVERSTGRANFFFFFGKSTFEDVDGVEHYWSESDWRKPKYSRTPLIRINWDG